MQTRRQALQTGVAASAMLGGAGLLGAGQAQAFTKSAFEAKTIAEAVKALGGNVLTASTEVSLSNAPDIAENGAVVPLGVATSNSGAKKLALLVEKNPNPLVAVFNVDSATEANYATRAKMSQSSDVFAVAIMADGRALFAKKEVKVTLGGCGG